jgi:TatD DNase family protein
MGKKRDIPEYSLPIIETHCHLDYLKENNPADTLQKASQFGIEKVITISVSPSNLKAVRELTHNHQNVWGTQGIHPHEAKLWEKSVEEEILEGLKEKKIVAVGEIGLDFHYNNSPRDKQIEVFNRQLEIAIKVDKPVVIHSRDADPETIESLETLSPQMKHKGVIHSFTSGPELAEKALDLGFHLGFNGIITFSKAENVRKIVEITPLEKILLETDAPFLTPVPYRGKENAPCYLPFIAEKIAELKKVSVQEVIEQTTKNALFLFNL